MNKILFTTTAAFALLVPVVANAQTFDGKTLDYQYYYPTTSAPYSNASNGSFVVGSGVEVANVVDNRGTLNVSGSNLFIDFSNSSSFGGGSFNGFILRDLTNNLPKIFGVSINGASNMSGFDMSRVLDG